MANNIVKFWFFVVVVVVYSSTAAIRNVYIVCELIWSMTSTFILRTIQCIHSEAAEVWPEFGIEIPFTHFIVANVPQHGIILLAAAVLLLLPLRSVFFLLSCLPSLILLFIQRTKCNNLDDHLLYFQQRGLLFEVKQNNTQRKEKHNEFDRIEAPAGCSVNVTL